MDAATATAGPALVKTDPSTGRVLGTFPAGRAEQVRVAAERAASASRGWADAGAVRRGDVVHRLAELIEAHRDELAASIRAETGKPVRDAVGEVERTVALVRFAAGFGRRTGGETLPSDTPLTASSTHRRPVGPVALITPWNFPLAIPAWKLAPALVAGCTVVLKPSPLAPRTAELLVDLAALAGVPDGVVSVVQGDGVTGDLLVSRAEMRAVSFTGSVDVGRSIHRAASRTMARTQLEMGGKNAVIVMEDADLDRAATAVVRGAFGQSGQRCSATSRVIAHAPVHDALVARIVEHAMRLRPGPPDDPSSDLGPLISEDAMRRCLDAVQASRLDGGTVLCGGERMGTVGNFVLPTVIVGLDPTAPLARTEVFGPVLVVLAASSLEEAIAIGNSVEYGMSAAIFTSDIRSVGRFVAETEAGMLHVNRAGTGAFPHMAHTGAKSSQFGPAECSEEGLGFFLETRTVTIDVS
ncbi:MULTISPECIES: aldehyde dehydrogenase family protein [Clavibacter]|uniref:Aldehyde dehydrogenase domain-containing protein n=1 Tax=Clavibacter tessellarius TaxID=31965 RepID=A0A154V2B1_9MICO|nr:MULTISPECIES: aldehyde dehydrogenase family protein [Clavibacter]KZC95516.1 hypothetical protein AWH51_07735 [Clavibacter michiganensis subsp. tessellarius]MDA3805921.1 aldehyde dehydrogenase family protein [Clavibacter sp. CT19]